MPTSQPNRTVRLNMRETLDLGMIPIVRDNLNGITFNISGSSNGYYGYQPQVASPKCEALQIDNDMEVDTELRTQNRKRIWTCEPGRVDLKKRRQEDSAYNFRKARDKKPNQKELLEKLLMETHGSSIYHWGTADL